MVKFQARHDPNAALAYFLGDPQLSEEERRGVWLGGGCEPAQLTPGMVVTREDLATVFEGRSPSGQLLLSKRQPNRRIAWDTVITPDKSVSVAALCLGAEVTIPIKAAFNEAVRELFGHMESLAHRQAPRPGEPLIPTGNLLAAQFVHQASRHADPHLHAHLLIMNSTYCADRRWRSVEASPLYRHQRALKLVFNSLLHTALHARGFGSFIAPDSLAKLPVPKRICETYSKAHAAIVGMARKIIESGFISEPWTHLPSAALLQRLNERSRPKERPKKPDWTSLLSGPEKAQVEALIVRPPHVPPPPPPLPLPPNAPAPTAFLLLRERWAALGHDRRKLKDLVATTAAEYPNVPLGRFAECAARLRKMPDPKAEGPEPSEEMLEEIAVIAPAADGVEEVVKPHVKAAGPSALSKQQVAALMKGAQTAARRSQRAQKRQPPPKPKA